MFKTSAFIIATIAWPALARAELRVVTTTPTLADIVRQIGGPHVRVDSIMRGPESSHNVVPKPSHMMKLRRARLFIHSGLDGELWAPLIAKGARKRRLLPGGEGNVDVSKGITLKQVPKRGELSRAQGDIHVFGNPHYVLDPLNVILIARTITDRLKREDAAHAELFEHNYADFARRLRELTDRLTARMRPYRGAGVATYHRTWPYFLDRFGLVKVAEVEPKPGIAPGPQHLSACIHRMQEAGARIIIIETFNPKKDADFVAARAGGRTVVLAHEVHALPECSDTFRLFEHNISALIRAFEAAGVEPRPLEAARAEESAGR